MPFRFNHSEVRNTESDISSNLKIGQSVQLAIMQSSSCRNSAIIGNHKTKSLQCIHAIEVKAHVNSSSQSEFNLLFGMNISRHLILFGYPQ